MVIFETLFKLKGVLQMGFPNDFGPLAPRKIEKAQHFHGTECTQGRSSLEVKNQPFQSFKFFLYKKCLFLDLKSQKLIYFYQENPSEPFSAPFLWIRKLFCQKGHFRPSLRLVSGKSQYCLEFWPRNTRIVPISFFINNF